MALEALIYEFKNPPSLFVIFMPIPWIKAVEGISRVKVRSITDPLFIFGLVTFAVGIAGSQWAPQWVTVIIIVFGSLFILTGLVFYCYFAFKNPKYLRSETFHIRMQSMEMMGHKDRLLPANKVNELPDTHNPYPTEEDAANTSL